MEGSKLQPARLSDKALHILREAETAINRQFSEINRGEEVYLIALNRNSEQ